jgi:hypothetical protein
MRAFSAILGAVVRSVKGAAAVAVLASAVGAAALIRAVDLGWRRLESDRTGTARWIWNTRDVREPHAVTFRASRAFRLEAAAPVARVKIFVDRSYRLFLDGARVGTGGMRPGDSLDVYDLPGGLSAGVHEFTIEASSPTGIGGILFALDASGAGRDVLVSDQGWSVDGKPVWVWGRPPIYPWRFPALARAQSASRAAAQ